MKQAFLNLLAYPRSILMTTLYLPFLILISGLCILVNLFLNRREVDDAFIRTWGRWSCQMFGVEVQLEGEQNLPPGGCLFVFNHTSFFDIFALSAVFPHIRFGAKIELFKIPVFGFAMRRVGILPIDRRNREGVFRVYERAQERLRQGERFALAPEGTRQDEERLGPFKSGPFVFAINTEAPVVPVVIRHASEIMPKHAWFPNLGTWRRQIRVIVLPAIEARNFQLKDRPQLQEKVREAMAAHF